MLALQWASDHASLRVLGTGIDCIGISMFYISTSMVRAEIELHSVHQLDCTSGFDCAPSSFAEGKTTEAIKPHRKFFLNKLVVGCFLRARWWSWSETVCFLAPLTGIPHI